MSAVNVHSLGAYNSLHLGTVVSNEDTDSRGRVQVSLHANDLDVWASVVAPSAGEGYGISFVPRLGEIVVLAFVTPEMPLVIGSVWTGTGSVPEAADPQEDHYVIKTPSGVVIELDDGDGPRIEMTTPQGYFLKLTDGGGGEIEITRGGQTIRMTSSDISLTASGPINIDGATVNISAGALNVDAGMSKFSGVAKADTVISNAVVSTSYTPGAGNIW